MFLLFAFDLQAFRQLEIYMNIYINGTLAFTDSLTAWNLREYLQH